MKNYVVACTGDTPFHLTVAHEADTLAGARVEAKESNGTWYILARVDTLVVTRETITKVTVTADPRVKRTRKATA